jgi:hypothetical protein
MGTTAMGTTAMGTTATGIDSTGVMQRMTVDTTHMNSKIITVCFLRLID